MLPGAAAAGAKAVSGPAYTIVDQPISSPADIANSALVIYRELRNKLNNRLTASGSTIGDPRIRADAVIRLEGLGPDFSGNYTRQERDAHDRRQRLSHELRGAEGDSAVIEETLERPTESIEKTRPKFYGVTTGRVINVLDPMTLGRVQVQLPFIDSLDLSPWARVAVPMAGITHGMYFIPNIGDEVLVAFEQGDINVPYVIGSLWTAMAPPPLQSPVPQIRAVRTLVGNQIVMTEAPPTITIQTGPTPPVVLPTPPTPAGPPTILLSPAGVVVMFGANVINMTQAGIQIMAGSNVINMTQDGITIAAANLNLAAVGSVNISGAAINITGALVKIN